MSVLSAGHRPRVSVFKIVPPQDGGWSLMPMENLLRGLRAADDMVSLELFGVDGVVGYGIRTTKPEMLSGMFHSYFPQSHLSSHVMGEIPGEVCEEDAGDWMGMEEGEFALVQSLSLDKENYLPLRVLDDRVIQQAEMDPLAGLIGVISSATGNVSPNGSDRLGVRLLIRPAPEGWSSPWQDRMQARRDGEDRDSRGGPADESGPSFRLMSGVLAAGLVLGMNWLFWNSGNLPGLVLFDTGMAMTGGLSYYLYRRFRGGRKRPYLDEELIEDKLKSLGFLTELQIVRIYSSPGDELAARSSLEQVVDCLRSFDNPAGNSWRAGRVQTYSGSAVVRREYKRSRIVGDNRVLGWLTGQDHDLHPFVGGSRILSWLSSSGSRRTILSAREVATVWHPPLGMNEMASMERIASGNLVPFLGDLSSSSEDSGPMVGRSGDREIHLPESAINKHAVVLGKSGVGKSTLVKHIVDYKLRRKAAGRDNGAMIIVDPHADLVRDILKLVPPEIAHKVRLLDFGRTDRVPGINLVDPHLFPDRDRCVDTIINTVKHLWDTWGGRLEDLLKNSLLIVYEFNSHPDTSRDQMLTMLDILLLLQDGETSGSGRNQTTSMSPFQRRVMARVTDERLKNWFRMYLNWPRETRAEAVGPVFSRVGAYAANRRAAVIMGQRESTIMFSDILSEGLVLLASTAQGTVGKGPAALMGGTIVSLVESALRDQESLDPSKRARCLLVCDEFQSVTGAGWEDMFAEGRKYGLSMMLATQSIARLDTQERRLKAGVLGNVGVIIGYQMSAEDAGIISAEMDSDRVSGNMLVNLAPHHCCVRIVSDSVTYPAFTMKTMPPPDATRGTQAAVEAVLEASLEYTVDWAEAEARLNEEAAGRMDEKLGAGTMGTGSDDAPVPAGAEPSGRSSPASKPDLDGVPGSLYETAMEMGAGDHPGNRRPRRRGSPEPASSPEPAVSPEPASFPEPAQVSEPAPEEREPVLAGAAASAENSGGQSRGRRSQSRAIAPEVVAESQLDPTVVEYINDPNNRDPALRAALDNRLGVQISRAEKRASRDADLRVKQEIGQAKNEAREEGRAEGVEEGFQAGIVAARAELAGELVPERGPRSLSGLERVSPEE